MRAKVAFYMLVYNTPEKYLRKAIESILNQTEKRIILFIQDNGSTDITKDILLEYSFKDQRVIVVRNEKNGNPTEEEYLYRNKIFDEKIKNSEVEYFAIIDSDDYYDKKFVEITYNIAKKFDLDLVMCGNDSINELGDKIISSRVPEKFNSINDFLTDQKFISLYKFFRTLWGKLYSIRLWDACWYIMDVERPRELRNGADTYLIFSLMMNNMKYITIDETLHYYRVREKSMYSSDISEYRIKEPTLIYLKVFEFIKSINICTEKNIEFLSNVYFQSIYDLVDIVFNNSKMNFNKKIHYIRKILNEDLLKIFGEKNIEFIYVILVKLNEYLKNSSIEEKQNAIKIMNNNTSIINDMKMDLLTYIENNYLDEANKLIDRLLVEQPLAEEIIYFKIYLSILKNIKCNTVEDLAMCVYPDSEEIEKLLLTNKS